MSVPPQPVGPWRERETPVGPSPLPNQPRLAPPPKPGVSSGGSAGARIRAIDAGADRGEVAEPTLAVACGSQPPSVRLSLGCPELLDHFVTFSKARSIA